MIASELRIGNLIQTDNSTEHFMDVEKVESIQHDGINITDGVGNTYETEFSYDFINPIPLTDDWLLKFGFLISNHKSWIKTHGIYPNQIDVELTPDFSLVYIGTKINHVHQLQNLYFALTGKELEII